MYVGTRFVEIKRVKYVVWIHIVYIIIPRYMLEEKLISMKRLINQSPLVISSLHFSTL